MDQSFHLDNFSMRICQISKADSFGGGASRVAEELTGLLNKEGIETHQFVAWSGKGLSEERLRLYGRGERYVRFAHKAVKKLGFPELIPFELPIFLRRGRLREYDLFHFHDLSSAISPLTLMFLSRFKPVVWTIHDCSPFTGGCLYPMGCERFKSGCGNCPQIGEWPLDCWFDFTRVMQRVKARLHRCNITCITPSRWMADMAEKSGVVTKRPIVINNGIDVSVYRLANKAKLKDELGIPTNRFVILLSAGSLDDPRKGIAHSIATVKRLSNVNPFLILLGNPDQKIQSQISNIEHKSLGYVSDPQRLADVYGCADLFLFCSLADNQPLSILEALACGTPVATFRTGGIPEVVIDDQVGIVVEPGNTEELAVRIQNVIAEDRLPEFSRKARERVVRSFSHSRLRQDHIDLYKELILSMKKCRRETSLLDPNVKLSSERANCS